MYKLYCLNIKNNNNSNDMYTDSAAQLLMTLKLDLIVGHDNLLTCYCEFFIAILKSPNHSKYEEIVMAETLCEDEDMKAIECGQRPQRTRRCCILS